MILVLNRIIKDVNTGDTFFDVASSDESLLCVKRALYSNDELVSYINSLDNPSCDFEIENGVLKCNPALNELEMLGKAIQDIKEDLQTTITEQPKNFIFKLLIDGVQNDFLLVDGDRSAWEAGYQVTAFRNIEFSKSSMSVYARMRTANNEIYNKKIIDEVDGRLQFCPFTYLVPEEHKDSLIGKYTGETIEINGQVYCVCETEMLSIWASNTVFSAGLVNESVNSIEGYNAAIKAINEVIYSIQNAIGNECTQATWVGGSSGPRYGVFFEGAEVALTKKQIQSLVKRLFEIMKEDDRKEQVKKLLGQYSHKGMRLIITSLAWILETETGTPLEILQKAYNMKTYYKERKFFLQLYCYRIRADIFMLHRALPDVLTGGRTLGYTRVNSCFKN